jgi:large subunit ribosomal protein L24
MRLPRRGEVESKLRLILTSHVTAKEGMLTLENLAGTVAGVSVRGRLQAGIGTPLSIDGQLETERMNVPAVLASAIGAAVQDETIFSAEPFTSGLLDALRGQLRLSTSRAVLTSGLTAREMHANVRVGSGEIALEDIDGEVAAGRLTGAMSFRRVGDGVAMHGRVALAEADATALLPGDGHGVDGKLSMQVEADATGRSPAALVGSLAGTGTVSLVAGEIARFDPETFNTVIRAVDQETTIDPAKVRDITAAALDRGNLRVPRADAAFAIAAGDVRLSTAILHGEGADLSATGHFNLADRQLDARLTFSAPAPAGSSAGRPEVYVTVRGPLGAAQRTIDATTLSAWLTLRAVDREARRIDALEAARAPSIVPSETAPAETGTVVPPPSPAMATPHPIAPPARRPAPPARPEASATPGTTAPALPPPINIRPPTSTTAPLPRPKAAGSGASPPKTTPSRAAPEPPAEERSLLERLFGSQR